VAAACALGFVGRLLQSIRSHAHAAVVHELAATYPTADSLVPVEHAVRAASLLAGGISEARWREAYEAHAAVLRTSAPHREPQYAPPSARRDQWPDVSDLE
jgi:hypothetical protein